MKTFNALFPVGVLLVIITQAHAAEPVQFYRIVSTQATRITSFNSEGTLTFSNSVSNAMCRIDGSISPSANSWLISKPVMWVRATNRTQSIAIPATATNEFSLQGTVVHLDIEGGFFGILGPLGEHYDPINLPAFLAVHGRAISIGARVCENQNSYHQWGTLIELILDPWIYD